jgi:ABC-2 type transport system permease protein
MMKEVLLLLRDRAGLAVLYLMPLCLVVIMAVVQDAPFRSFQEHKVSVLFRDHDSGTVGEEIRDGLSASGAFDVTVADSTLTEQKFRDQIRKGDYQVGIIVPEGVSSAISARSFGMVDGMLAAITTPADSIPVASTTDSATVRLVIDPTVKLSFRQTLHSVVERLLTGISSKQLVGALSQRMGEMTGGPAPQVLLSGLGAGVAEELATTDAFGTHVATNSTQHNVPAWTIFAMFFMVVPLSGNMVRERSSGAALRLRTMPGGPWLHLSGKLVVYLGICLSQFVLLLAMGRWGLPHLGLHSLVIGDGLPRLLLAAMGIGMAATAYGIVVGTVFRTHQQSAIFGAVSVVILSAVGGIWVPLYIMPAPMQAIGSLSPLAWSLDAFNVVLLRNGGWAELAPHVALLLAFAFACLAYSIWHEQRQQRS